MSSQVPMKQTHKELKDMLYYVDQILKKNKIWYSICCGTALGAMREKGFIEWDNDVDIFVFNNDLDKVRKVIKKELPSKFSYLSYSEDFVSSHDRIISKEYGMLFSLDIYPLIGFPSDKEEIIAFIKRCRFINKLYGCKYGNHKLVRNKAKVPVFLMLKLILHTIPDNILRKCIRNLNNKYPLNTAKNVSYIALDGRVGEVMEKKIFLDTMRIPFENIEVEILKSPDLYLLNVYGPDYMIPKKC